ncbi:sigma-70 family RNA polymerase sigma factor [Streptomyces sp. NBC_01803]|uniref:sigma-70 family RNA polymerase sigma factor n=1 Tax=Streptomyces sp. NBC_01803 TaxID=2975946 RepID=UPI002DDB7D9C|nr:sigma-70 family RNA polymerase sigma factor [Streptomyces sp. NBC_01803]WSA45675.1 sigma-70 family RNA polymerase sigma factor [Streptomyces sp. NBC_01803]
MSTSAATAGASPTAAPPPVTELQLEQHRKELTGYCYRMLGSAFEAEDAVQETMVRAWRGLGRFEGRSSLRSWLYRIATNVCLTMLSGSSRRARPMDLSSPTPTASAVLGPPLPETAWIEPMPDSRTLPDPAEKAEQRDSVRLALVAALQHLAPRQRAVLILREVLSWKAGEVAELLDTTVASVNSALQRARATLAATGLTDADPSRPLSDEHKALLSRYLDAFERYDMDALTALLAEDATLSMPPYDLWMRGPSDIREWMLGQGIGCADSRLIPTWANGAPAFGQYRAEPDGGHSPWALQVIEVSDGRITGINAFLDTARLFPLFGLPAHLPKSEPAQEPL